MGLLLLVTGGWWVAREPARAVEKPSAEDVEAQDRWLAKADVAVVPPGPASVAAPQAVRVALPVDGASSAAASERCGVDDGPQAADWTRPDDGEPFLPLELIPTRGALPPWVATQARVAASLRASADPFDQAVADALNVGQMRTRSGAVDALAQRAVATRDARVYWLALSACRRLGFERDRMSLPASCAALSAANWAALDPDNGVPWMAAMQEAVTAHDARAEQAAFDGMASATRFDARLHASAAAIGAHAAAEAGQEAAVMDLQLRAFADSAAMAAVLAPMQSCKAALGVDVQRVQQCLRIADGLFDRGDDLLLRLLGGALRFQLTGETANRDAARADVRRFSKDVAETEPTACVKLRANQRFFNRAGQVGELAAWRELAAASATP